MTLITNCPICGGRHKSRPGWRDSWNHNPPTTPREELQWMVAQLDAVSKRHATEIAESLLQGCVRSPRKFLRESLYEDGRPITKHKLALARLVLTSPTLAARARTPAYEYRMHR